MQAYLLKHLLGLIGRLEDRVLYEIATCPLELATTEEDRTIIHVARGERAWRLECQK